MVFDFPALDPVAFALGPFQIRWYALAYLSGFLIGWWYVARFVERYYASDSVAITRRDVDDFVSWAIVGVILGGRIGYVLFYQFSYFIQDPFEIFKIWHGGMSFHGGALGVVAAVFLFSCIRRLPVLRLSDAVVCAAPVGLFFGRVANFVNAELYGRVTAGEYGVVFPGGGDLPRHPSQLYEAALEGVLLFVLLFVLSRLEAVRGRPGILSGVFFVGYALFRAFVELFREPDAHIGFVWGAISMGQVLCLPMFVLGLGLLVYAVLGKRSDVHAS